MEAPNESDENKARKFLLSAVRSEASGDLSAAMAFYKRAYKLDPSLEFDQEDFIEVDGVKFDRTSGQPVHKFEWENQDLFQLIPVSFFSCFFLFLLVCFDLVYSSIFFSFHLTFFLFIFLFLIFHFIFV